MKIQRDFYLNQLIAGRENGLIKIITGIRRCGKSYLLFNLFHEWLNDNGIDDNHIIEVALDDRSNKALRDPDALLDYVKSQITDKSLHFILLDEIQIVSEFTDVLNSLLHIRNRKQLAFPFNGRGDGIPGARGRNTSAPAFICGILPGIPRGEGQGMEGILHLRGIAPCPLP